MKPAEQVVALMLENELVRVCMYCDKERPLTVEPGQVKSHGMCRKHASAYAKDVAAEMGDPSFEAHMRAEFDTKPDSYFAPSHT